MLLILCTFASILFFLVPLCLYPQLYPLLPTSRLCSTSINICITIPLSPASPTLLAVPYPTHYLSPASPIHFSTYTIPLLSHPLPIPHLPNPNLYLSPIFLIPPSTYPPLPNPSLYLS